jgi:hypothetical protein
MKEKKNDKKSVNKITKIWEQKFQKSRNKSFKNPRTKSWNKISKIREQELQKSWNKNYKNPGTRIMKTKEQLENYKNPGTRIMCEPKKKK